MEIEFITGHQSDKLIVIFLGWGMEATSLAGVSKPAYDIVAVSDYRDIGPDCAWQPLADAAAGYGEVVVVAWSFGVRAAACFLRGKGKSLPVTKRIAVNGTTAHIHDAKGIPTAIFNGTLANLSEPNLRKFRRRMFSSAAEFAHFMESGCSRPFDTLKEELELFGRMAPDLEAGFLFDLAVIGEKDAIFPPAAQLEFWGKEKSELWEGMPHFPDFERILKRHVIDKELVASRFAASASTYRDNAPVQARVAEQLWRYAGPYAPAALASGGRVLEVGVGDGVLTRSYAPDLPPAQMMLWDIAPLNPTMLPEGAALRQCDAEIAIRELQEGSLSMLISASTLQWFNNPAEFIRQACRRLSHGGVLAISSFGPKTFREISDVTGTGLTYPDIGRLAEIVREEGCSVAVCHTDTVIQRFSSAKELLRHLKLTGVNAVSRGQGETAAAMRLLKTLHKSATEPALTYEPIYLVAIKD